MSFNVSFNGTTYPLPSVGDRIYATYINTFLTAVANNALAKSGGTFTLTADVNFGASYGPIVAYIKSRSSNISTTGVLRLANNEGIGWRNAANSADLILKLDSGNRLELDGVDIPTISSTDTFTNKSISGSTNTITNVSLTSGVTGTLPVANGGTGITSFGSGVATFLGTPSSANLASAVTDETGTGALVFANSPTLVTPALGTPSAAVLTNATGLPLTTGVTGTLPIANGGTGQTTANTALNALLPSQGSSANKYLKTDGTNTSWASASGGAGELNVILNASGADGTTGWTGTSVVSGASSPLNPVVTTAFSISNSATTESSTSGGYYPFTMPSGMLNRKLKVEFTFTTPATDVYRVSVYSGTTRVATNVADATAGYALPASVTGGKFTAYFDTDSSTSWTLSVTRTSGSTGACVITNVIVGPGIQPQGAVVGDWVSYTPSGSDQWTTNATFTGSYRRVGSQMELQLKVNGTSSAPSGGDTSNLKIYLPSGFNIDMSKIPNFGTNGATVGRAVATYSGVGNIYSSVRIVSSSVTDRINVWRPVSTGPSATNNEATIATTDIPAVTWNFSVYATVPIAEWAGSGTVNVAQNDVEYAYNTSGITAAGASDTTSFGYGPIGAAIGSINSTTGSNSETTMRVRFQTPIQAGDILRVEVDNGTSGAQWVEIASTGIAPGLFQGASIYGINIRTVNTTDVAVKFGNRGYQPTNATYAGDGAAWSGISTWRWRVRKSSAGAAVGFGMADTQGNAGLVNPYSSSGAGVVYSGTYTPTIAAVTNAAGTKTAFQTHYIRVGQRVMVTGYMEVTGTGSALNEVTLTLPIASTLGTSDLYGTAVSQNKEKVGGIQPSGNLALVGWTAADSASHGIYFNFMYEIN